ncbi:MAG: site-specific integrase, partial [Ruminococcus sp.]|nr:site-specific integrase [Ruminococcus sp.]
EEWLMTVKMNRKISTYNKYRNLYANYISPVMGGIPVKSINGETVGKLVRANERLSAKTNNDIFLVVRMILKYAADNGCTSEVNFKNIGMRQERKEVRILSPEEQRKFIRYLLDSPDLRKIGIFLTLCTGVRVGELCALKREDISFADGILNVNKTMQRVQADGESAKTKIIIDRPKSQCSKRVIPLPGFAMGVLSEHYEHLAPDCYLLTGDSEKFIEPRNMEYYFKNCVNKCGITPVNFHALRHTFATRCIEAGFDVKTLSEILGHANVNITLNRYVHSSLELKRINMEKLEAVF